MTADDFRQVLTDYLTEPEWACVEVIKIDDADCQTCMGVTLDDGSRFFLTIQKMAGGAFPGTENIDG